FQAEDGIRDLIVTGVQTCALPICPAPAPAGHAHAMRPGVRPDRVGVTGWCWGGSTVYQVAATNADIKAAVAWYGPPARPYPDARSEERRVGKGRASAG